MRSLNKNTNYTSTEAAEVHFPRSVDGAVKTGPKRGVDKSEVGYRLIIFRVEFRATEVSGRDSLKGWKTGARPRER
jgi:hypothetical protein